MKIVISAATTGEWMPAFRGINEQYTDGSKPITVNFYQTGVGLLSSAVSFTRLMLEQKPGLVIQAGIAGSFDSSFPPGKVVVVKDEYLGDTGVEENEDWKDVFDLGLENPGKEPFQDKKLSNPWIQQYNLLNLPEVTGITVNEISTQIERINKLKQKYNPVVESMEGASLHYTAGLWKIPFIQIRAISNYVGERDKANWRLKEAIENVNHDLLLLIQKLIQLH